MTEPRAFNDSVVEVWLAALRNDAARFRQTGDASFSISEAIRKEWPEIIARYEAENPL